MGSTFFLGHVPCSKVLDQSGIYIYIYIHISLQVQRPPFQSAMGSEEIHGVETPRRHRGVVCSRRNHLGASTRCSHTKTRWFLGWFVVPLVVRNQKRRGSRMPGRSFTVYVSAPQVRAHRLTSPGGLAAGAAFFSESTGRGR